MSGQELPSGWIQQFDSVHQTAFYVNVVNGESQWEVPDRVAKGWSAEVDISVSRTKTYCAPKYAPKCAPGNRGLGGMIHRVEGAVKEKWTGHEEKKEIKKEEKEIKKEEKEIKKEEKEIKKTEEVAVIAALHEQKKKEKKLKKEEKRAKRARERSLLCSEEEKIAYDLKLKERKLKKKLEGKDKGKWTLE
ncbi:hypothetical protein NEOLI_004195 [Neolecta irregularis DAH-3]|uniref:WW domain-containing protein n=1 Tax=Neolecta irregularis (strain DAH-3) TaxID=1198029 RepID=A0A1U7LRK3_NEOID|nr:hypothetical protein NEOLI_004195 [Neolecta irregularis DAH-3]|eukprot:OLL25287.1 hypothetical protein NEOLI_004195 [Neolecta irregularis DAH-3]